MLPVAHTASILPRSAGIFLGNENDMPYSIIQRTSENALLNVGCISNGILTRPVRHSIQCNMRINISNFIGYSDVYYFWSWASRLQRMGKSEAYNHTTGPKNERRVGMQSRDILTKERVGEFPKIQAALNTLGNCTAQQGRSSRIPNSRRRAYLSKQVSLHAF
jgi:hypothetical protein